MNYHHDNYQETETIDNPWLSIWTEPKRTIRYIVTTNPQRSMIFLATTYGIYQVLERDDFISLLENIGALGAWAIAIIGGFILGLLSLYIYSALLKWTGSWLNGKADSTEIRAAYAWSNVPYVLMVIILIIDIFMVQPIISSSPTSLVLLSINFVLVIWSCVILCRSLAEIQGFSSWTGLGNILLASLMGIIFVAIFTIIMVLLVFALR